MPCQSSGSVTSRTHAGNTIECRDVWENEGGSVVADNGQCPIGDSLPLQLPVALDVIDALALGILLTSQAGEIIHSNPAYQRLCLTPADKLLGTHWCRPIDPRDRLAAETCCRQQMGSSENATFEVRMVGQTGRLVWTRRSIARLTLANKRPVHIHTIEDISASKARDQEVMTAKTALSQECERARVTLECIGDAVISTDAEGRVSYMNTVAEQLTGWTREKAHGLPFRDVFRVVDSTTRLAAQNPAQRAVEADGIVQLAANCSLLRADGSELEIEDSAAPILDSSGQPAGAVVIFRDRRHSQATLSRMSYLARHDPLTELPNRVTLIEHFEQALNLAHRHDGQLAVLFIDIDHFKQVNDAFGHKTGDTLLSMIAGKLVDCVRVTDIVCRYGGDEFVVLLNNIKQAEHAALIANKMQAAVRNCSIDNHATDVSLSIGISLYPDHGADIDTLLRHADAAMYLAKAKSEPGHCFY